MTFKGAVAAAGGLADAYRPGLQALKRSDRQRIRCANTRRLTGSVDLDAALADSHPDDPRWDYGVGLRHNGRAERVIWIEVHSASSSHIRDVLRKLAWLKRWIEFSAPLLNKMPKKYVWIASGKVALPRNSPQRRELASKGIDLVGERLEL